jgi:hypothetical protein
MYAIFESNDIIKSSGDHNGFIFNPACVEYKGESFQFYPGPKLLIVPHQPDNGGPWQQHQITFVDDQFLRNKKRQIMCYMLENRWLNKPIMISKGMNLEYLLLHIGISHEMVYATKRDLVKIEGYMAVNGMPSPPINSKCMCTCSCGCG